VALVCLTARDSFWSTDAGRKAVLKSGNNTSKQVKIFSLKKAVAPKASYSGATEQNPFRRQKRIYGIVTEKVRTEGSVCLSALRGWSTASPDWKEKLKDACEGKSKQDIVKPVAENNEIQQIALFQLRVDFFAANTVKSYDSETKLYVMFCEHASLKPFPLTGQKIQMFGAALKTAKYRGALSYMSAIVSCNKMLGFEVDSVTWNLYLKVRKSLECGISNKRQAEPFPLICFKAIKIPEEHMTAACFAVVCIFVHVEGRRVLS